MEVQHVVQTAMDRLQQAACRSPMTLPCDVTGEEHAIFVTHELYKDGVVLIFKSTRACDGEFVEYRRQVTWDQIALSIPDPLELGWKYGLDYIKGARHERPTS